MRKFIILLVCALLFIPVSCKAEQGDPFCVFDGDFVAGISVRCEDSECQISYDSSRKSISFTSPGELDGYVMRLDNGVAYIRYDGVEIALSEYAGRLAFVCDAVFSVSADAITDIIAKSSEDETLTVVKTENVTYTFKKDGAPVSACGYFDGIAFEMTFLSFTGVIE